MPTNVPCPYFFLSHLHMAFWDFWRLCLRPNSGRTGGVARPNKVNATALMWAQGCRNRARGVIESPPQFWWSFNPTRGRGQIIPTILKLRHYEKVTKYEKISHLFWQNNCFYSVVSKQVGDFFKFLWPFQKNWTLKTVTKSRNNIGNKPFFHILWDLLVC